MDNNKRNKLWDMLSYMRPDGSLTQAKFNLKYLHPVMGKPDRWGNFVHIIGDRPNVAFMAHHDTVHSKGGRQELAQFQDLIYAPDSDCLGADCTTGIWLILEMIEANIPGVYVVHGGEEIGCIGSSALVKANPSWIKHVDVAISFDRKGTDSIITKQMYTRTCSDSFAESLAGILALYHVPDPTGSFTDSNEYRGVIAECTNLSVGYYFQHSPKETQDITYLWELRNALLSADWSKLVIEREATLDDDYSWRGWYGANSEYDYYGYKNNSSNEETEYCDTVLDIVEQYPGEVADILEMFGYTAETLAQEIENNYYGRQKA